MEIKEKLTVVHYTEYQTHSYRSYYGPGSYTKKVDRTITVREGKTTEKAIELTLVIDPAKIVDPTSWQARLNGAKCWVPKSAIQENADGSITIKKSFVYYSGWPQWKQVNTKK